MKAFAPNGLEIRGTLETVSGVAKISFFNSKDAEGKIDFEYGGETDIWWDEQKTIERDGQRIFVDTEGNEWPENLLILKEEEPEMDNNPYLHEHGGRQPKPDQERVLRSLGTPSKHINVTAEELAYLLEKAATAHHEYEAKLGAKDERWPQWYAGWIAQQVGAHS